MKLAAVEAETGQPVTATKEWMPGVSRLDSLTSLRFFGALFVALHHSQSQWACSQFTDLMGQLGWLGVSFFFVLSGFVLMWGYDPLTSYRNFVLRRLARIYPMHVMTLIFSLLVFFRFGSPLAGYVGNFWGTITSFLLIHDWWPLKPMVRQAWNGVSWTLGCEFFFYLCAPRLFARLIKMESRQYWLFAVLWAGSLAFSVLATMQHWGRVLDILEYFPVPRFLEFALGAAAAVLLKRRSFRISKMTALVVLFLPIAVYCILVPSGSGLRSAPVMTSLVTPGALLLIVAAAMADIRGDRSMLRMPVLIFLGEASFAFYMTHALLLGLVRFFVSRFFPGVTDNVVQAECFRVIYVSYAILLSCIVYYYVEHPIRARLLQAIRVLDRVPRWQLRDFLISIGEILDTVRRGRAAASAVTSNNRIAYLDGLRGVSILLVLFHHAFGAWNVMFKQTNIMQPYDHSISFFPPVAYGYLAVWLFFFISGYVIFMTLEKCRSYSEFLFRRWLRLFPAMLICSALVYFTSSCFPERPMGMPSGLSLLSGLTFIDPSWLQIILGRPTGVLEGSFWSLFVEARFYILFGALYFGLGKRRAIAILVGLFALGLYARYFHSSEILERHGSWRLLGGYADIVFGSIQSMGLWGTFCDTLDYGMFASGVFFALYSRSRQLAYLVVCGMLGAISAVTHGLADPYGFGGINTVGIAIALVIMCLIPLSTVFNFARRFWANRLFVFFGFISYPLYLAHQNMMVAMIIKVQSAYPALPAPLMAVGPIGVVVGIAWIITKFVEPLVNDFIKESKDRLSKWIELFFGKTTSTSVA